MVIGQKLEDLKFLIREFSYQKMITRLNMGYLFSSIRVNLRIKIDMPRKILILVLIQVLKILRASLMN